jgi:hypothetical protein
LLGVSRGYWTQYFFSMRVSLGLGVLFSVLACKAAPTAAPPPDASAPPTVDEYSAATDAIRSLNPVWCSAAHADFEWATCHDETKGYAAFLACTEATVAKVTAAQGSLPKAVAEGKCGAEVDGAVRVYINDRAKFFPEYVAWLKANRSKVEPLMRGATIIDATDKDSSLHEPMSPISTGPNAIECVQKLFRCGPSDNVCWVPKVAARLGVACDPAENKPNDLRPR